MSIVCLLTMLGGNVKRQAALGDARMNMFSDRGSIPLASTSRVPRHAKRERGTHFILRRDSREYGK